MKLVPIIQERPQRVRLMAPIKIATIPKQIAERHMAKGIFCGACSMRPQTASVMKDAKQMSRPNITRPIVERKLSGACAGTTGEAAAITVAGAMCWATACLPKSAPQCLHRVKDLELARWLGFENQYKIRDLVRIKVRNVAEAAQLLGHLRPTGASLTPPSSAAPVSAKKPSGGALRKALKLRDAASDPSVSVPARSQDRRELVQHLNQYCVLSNITSYPDRSGVWMKLYNVLAERGYNPRARRTRKQTVIEVIEADQRTAWVLAVARELFPLPKFVVA